MATASRLIPMQAGDVLIDVGAVPVAGVEPTESDEPNAVLASPGGETFEPLGEQP
jgi:hypothetical protein